MNVVCLKTHCFDLIWMRWNLIYVSWILLPTSTWPKSTQVEILYSGKVFINYILFNILFHTLWRLKLNIYKSSSWYSWNYVKLIGRQPCCNFSWIIKPARCEHCRFFSEGFTQIPGIEHRTNTERVRELERNGYRMETEWISNGYRTDTEQWRITKTIKAFSGT